MNSLCTSLRYPAKFVVTLVTAGAMMTTFSPSASAAPSDGSSSGRVTVADRPLADQLVVDQIIAGIDAAKARGLAPGGSEVVYQAGGVTLLLDNVDGTYVLRVDAGAQTRGFCHWSAMAAVYTIGAAAFAAAAAVGGITVVGIAISAEAANALSIALATGGGVSGLVSEFIC
ncbi:hypothetical protein AB0O91_38130 [Kitasatospora sp. NPDC089797]|uniref:hypothetical protein n=1 Tax=Kitasatospora sp. NPDC089797 TaxID=3155298 RepID=UPI00342CECF3